MRSEEAFGQLLGLGKAWLEASSGLRPVGAGLAEVRGNRPALLPPGRDGAAHRRCVQGQAQDGLGAEDKVLRPDRAHGRRRLGADSRQAGGPSSPVLTIEAQANLGLFGAHSRRGHSFM